MNLESCCALVRAEVEASVRFVTHHVQRNLVVDKVDFRIRPDETFEVSKGFLLLEYERTRRPVESVSKYWWLFYGTDWLNSRKRISLVLFLLESKDLIRRETVVILGRELQRRFPQLFSFSFVSPEATPEEVRHVVQEWMSKFG